MAHPIVKGEASDNEGGSNSQDDEDADKLSNSSIVQDENYQRILKEIKEQEEEQKIKEAEEKML